MVGPAAAESGSTATRAAAQASVRGRAAKRVLAVFFMSLRSCVGMVGTLHLRQVALVAAGTGFGRVVARLGDHLRVSDVLLHDARIPLMAADAGVVHLGVLRMPRRLGGIHLWVVRTRPVVALEAARRTQAAGVRQRNRRQALHPLGDRRSEEHTSEL